MADDDYFTQPVSDRDFRLLRLKAYFGYVFLMFVLLVSGTIVAFKAEQKQSKLEQQLAN